MAHSNMTLDELNKLSDPAAKEALSQCCSAGSWVREMLARRPFASFEDLLIASDEAFATLERVDWLAAFAGHPQIGDLAALRQKFAAAEQAAVAHARDEELAALARGNQAYAEKFGYIFIVSATGKSVDEMLALLMERMENDPEAELPVAATEQMKITHLRLHKLISDAL